MLNVLAKDKRLNSNARQGIVKLDQLAPPVLMEYGVQISSQNAWRRSTPSWRNHGNVTGRNEHTCPNQHAVTWFGSRTKIMMMMMRRL
jgi:hypothetical protein